jgi:aminodeoxyfutalosine deaminase
MILSARWLVPITSPFQENAAVFVEDGQIKDFGASSEITERYQGQEVHHFPGMAILPGFVNVHSHLELTVLRGFLEGLSFWDWIRRLTRIKYEVLSEEDIILSSVLGAAEALRAGITTVADPMDYGASLEGALVAGLRALLYQEVFSPVPEEAGTALQGLKDKMLRRQSVLNEYSSGQKRNSLAMTFTLTSRVPWVARAKRLSLGLSPHAPYTVSGALFQQVHRLATAEGWRTCIHVAESREESLLIEEGRGPIMESWQKRGISWTPSGCSPLRYLDRLGVIDKTTLLVHCLQLTDEDYEILLQQKPAVAHCPKSNWKLRHGFMNLKRMVECKIPIGLGSDSVASNNTMDFFEEMRMAFFNPSWIGDPYNEPGRGTEASRPEEMLRMATLGGAEALGLASHVGSIERGKDADLIVVDLSGLHNVPVYSPITALVLSAHASDVRLTMVGGEILFDRKGLTLLDEKTLVQRIETLRLKLINALG